MASTGPGKPHPLTGKVFNLHGQGYSQRQIAAMVELSQSTVQRILSGPAPDDSDPDGVFAEFAELTRAARADGSLDAFRRLREVMKTCRANGYNVPFPTLPFISALSTAELEASTAGERNSLRAEIMMVYQDMREWRERNV